jgi:hypothetical protein
MPCKQDAGNLHLRACAQSVSSNQHEVTGFLDLYISPQAARPQTWGCLQGRDLEDLDVFTLLSFQRPVLLW